MDYCVIGLGRFGAKLATSLFSKGGEVLGIDIDSNTVEKIKDHISHVAIADCTDELALRSIGVQDMDVVIIAMGEKIETSILATAILKRLGVPKIMARSVNRIQAQILTEVGAHEVFSLEEFMGEQMAAKLIAPQILENIALASGHSLVEAAVPKKFLGKSLKELNLRATARVNVIAVKKRVPAINEKGENIFKMILNDLPSPDAILNKDDILVVIGSDKNLQLIFPELGGENNDEKD